MFITKENPLLALDCYKMGHMSQFKPGTEFGYSYYCHRSDRYFNKGIFFGLQYYLKQYLSTKLTREMGEEFIEVYNNVLGECPEDIKHKIMGLCDLGYFPLEIKALPEGTIVPTKVPCFTIKNTVKGYHWVVGFVESLLLKVWYPSTVTTSSRQYKEMIDKFFERSVDEEMYVLKDFMVHDFGYRGDSSEEGAALSGCCHLLNFVGSDTIPALSFTKKFYNADTSNIMKSVPASEHSVACSFGADGEVEYIQNMLDLYPEGIVSIVSDQYDVYRFFNEYIRSFKEQILNRNGTTVLRPDSGSQYHVICGYKTKSINLNKVGLLNKVISDSAWIVKNTNDDYEAFETTDGHFVSYSGKALSKEEVVGCLRILDDIFGSTLNKKGFKVLNEKVGLIYGDGMYFDRYEKIQNRIMEMGFSAQNLIIGVGGILRNYSRDTLGSAIKSTWIEANGTAYNIFKNPITDDGTKKSACGLLKVTNHPYTGEIIMLDEVEPHQEEEGLLETVFENGKLLVDHKFEDIRERLAKQNV